MTSVKRQRAKRKFINRLNPTRSEYKIGKVDGTLTDDTLSAGQIYVHSESDRDEIVVNANGYFYQVGAVVYVDNDANTGEPTIVGVNYKKTRELLGEAVGIMNLPVLPTDAFPYKVPMANLGGFRLQKQGTTGLAFKVVGAPYWFNGAARTPQPGNIDLTSTQSGITANRQIGVVVWFDVALGEYGTSSTSEYVLSVGRDQINQHCYGVDLGKRSRVAVQHIILNDSTAPNFRRDIFPAVPWLSSADTLNNFTATAAPTATDDADDGYSVGSRWIDTTTNEEYTCRDATAGAAVWQRNGSGDSDGVQTITTNATIAAGDKVYWIGSVGIAATASLTVDATAEVIII